MAQSFFQNLEQTSTGTSRVSNMDVTWAANEPYRDKTLCKYIILKRRFINTDQKGLVNINNISVYLSEVKSF